MSTATKPFDPGAMIGSSRFKLPFNDEAFDPNTAITIRCAFCDWSAVTDVSKRRDVFLVHREQCEANR